MIFIFFRTFFSTLRSHQDSGSTCDRHPVAQERIQTVLEMEGPAATAGKAEDSRGIEPPFDLPIAVDG